MQTFSGYFNYEFLQYFKELYIVTFPQIMTFTLLAFFIQTVVSNKFVGHGILIGVAVLTPIVFNFGWENTLYLFGATPSYRYSDMNGYGHFVSALFWSITYWLAISAVLGVVSIVLARRGAEDAFRSRLTLARERSPRLLPLAACFALVAVGSGAWYFYNAHILNRYENSRTLRDQQADYERRFKKYENLVQPKVTEVDVSVNIYPDRRSFDGSARIVLQNKSSGQINQIHLTDTLESVKNVHFDRPFHLVSSAPRNVYSIYALERPLAPVEAVTLTCSVGHQTKGFRDGHELPEFAHNGTFFSSEYFPTIGYTRGVELVDPRRRREEHLPPLKEMAHRGDPVAFAQESLFSNSLIGSRITRLSAPHQIKLL